MVRDLCGEHAVALRVSFVSRDGGTQSRKCYSTVNALEAHVGFCFRNLGALPVAFVCWFDVFLLFKVAKLLVIESQSMALGATSWGKQMGRV